MCGIAGLAAGPLGNHGFGGIEQMLGPLARRGPDAEGRHAWGACALAHRRLAILDLSDRGRQPMVSDDGAVGVVFNGAIYNYRSLRQELRAAGCTFRSGTDTEVLLHGYRVWGAERLVARLVGMFAFAVWDDSTRELFLVRDRLGVKPLAYAVERGVLAFGSTVAAVRAAGFGSDTDPRAIADFLEWGVVPEDRSLFEGIRKLPPATLARWHDGELLLETYWTPPTSSTGGPRVSFEDALDSTEELFLEAVRRRTEADVPIGALLSGGIDSALVCWGLREVGAKISAYTFSAPGQPEDESAEALATARELGIDLVVLDDDGEGDLWEDLARAYPEPFACGSALGMLRLSQVVRNSATVLLTGDGGDDVFLGYPHHLLLRRMEQAARVVPRPVAAVARAAGLRTPMSGGGRRPLNFAAAVAGGLGEFLRIRHSYRYLAQAGALGPRLHAVEPSTHLMPAQTGGGQTILRDYLEFTRGHQFVAEYLAKVDGATMYHGVEARSPFLDQDLWSFAATLPFDVRLRGGVQKALLRELACRRISPRVAAGRKRGFEVPVSAWLGGRWRERVLDLLGSAAVRTDGWIDADRLSSTLRTGAPPPLPVWNAVVLAHWLETDRASNSAGVSRALTLG
jgi:asparagine synthase (glutamine-hydrolysing)